MDPRQDKYDVMVHNYLHFVSISIFFFDYLVTLGAEVAYIWRKPTRVYSITFFVLRYLPFAVNIGFTVLAFAQLSSKKSCTQAIAARTYLLIVLEVFVRVLMLWRTYALYWKNVRVLCFMLLLATGLISLAVWSVSSTHTKSTYTLFQCHAAYNEHIAIHSATAWETIFVWDLCILTLTVYRTYEAVRPNRENSHDGVHYQRRDLVFVLFRDGSMYFLAMGLANLANVLSFYLAPPILKGDLATFANCVSVTLMARLMLNLQEVANNYSWDGSFIVVSIVPVDEEPIQPELSPMVFSPVLMDDSQSVAV